MEPRITAIPLIQSLRYYDHFILATTKDQSIIFFSEEPLLTGSDLTGLYCNWTACHTIAQSSRQSC